MTTSLRDVIERRGDELLARWLEGLESALAGGKRRLLGREGLQTDCRNFLSQLDRALASGSEADLRGPAWDELRAVLADLSRERAVLGFSPTETATFVFSLKQPLFDLIREEPASGDVTTTLWEASTLLDRLGLFTMEAYQARRDEIIRRQQDEVLELSTPVVRLWEGVLLLPLIGTLDSARTQVVMESLLEKIDETQSTLAILDITGVPTVDSLVAQHLLKTAAAARLMGAEVILSGIRPQIAQTVVQLGVELPDVTTKASIADAFAVALDRLGWTLMRPGRD